MTRAGLGLVVLLVLFFELASAAPISNNSFLLTSTDKYNSLIWTPSNSGDWYEWWYYKVIDPQTGEAYYFCYGLVNPWDARQTQVSSRAYVNVGNFSEGQIIEQTFTPQNFANDPTSRAFSITNNNSLSPRHLRGDIQNADGQRVQWDITTQTEWSYNAMGWVMAIPEISNIYWYPAQASLRMSGWINFNGHVVNLSNALGYQDRNWGRSFPKWWAWIVSNNFQNSPGTVLVSGGGKPKILNALELLETFTIGLHHQNKDYTFRLSEGDKITMNIRFGHWYVDAINQRNQRVVVKAFAPQKDFLLIPFMTPQGNIFKDYEALKGTVDVMLYKRANRFSPWEKIDQIKSIEAGIEFGSPNDQDFQQLFSTGFRF